MESYTIGRECFGMEKEFIIEVVQNCPNPACRYYKNQLELSQKSLHLSAPTYISESGGQDKYTLHLTTKIFFFFFSFRLWACLFQSLANLAIFYEIIQDFLSR